MTSTNNTLPSPCIADVMSLLCTMKKQNEEILARNEEILTKLNSIEDDNRHLRQELLEMKNSQNHSNSLLSNRCDESEDKAEKYKNQQFGSKIIQVSVANLLNPDPPASFDTLDNDCLGNILDFVGKKCYSAFGRVNKRCHDFFCSRGFTKETYLYGYGSLRFILLHQRRGFESKLSKGVLHCNRRDVLEWMFRDESDDGYRNLKSLCCSAIEESRKDILREVFRRMNERQLEYVRNCYNGFDLCYTSAKHGKLELLNWSRLIKCGWDYFTWEVAERYGHEHILEYLRENGYPTEWQVDGNSQEDSDY